MRSIQARPRKVAPGVFMLEVAFFLGAVSKDQESVTLCYLVDDGDGWLLVDCGYNGASSFESLCSQLDSVGARLADIKYILLTHYHPDHSGLANRIKAASGAKVIIHEDDWRILQSVVASSEIWNIHGMIPWAKSLGVPQGELDGFLKTATLGRMLFPAGLQADVLLSGEENTVGDSGRLEAILTPGHSPGHVCFYDKNNRLLFSGDHVLGGITPHISPSHLTSYNQLGQYLDALRKVQHLEADVVLPAHEAPFYQLAQRVDELLEHHRVRLDEVVAAISSKVVSPWDIAVKVEWSVGKWEQMDATNRLLAVRETVAHLQFLESQGTVTRLDQTGQTLYALVAG
jgi:glyoxylase-like metal-dependent hydrolase (beta-lactamase superfamily II)